AIAVRVLRQVLLVVGLRVVELVGGLDLGGDVAVAGGPELLLIALERRLGSLALSLVRPQNQRAVLRADVVALPHALRRIVRLPEGRKELVIGDALGVEDAEDSLRRAGQAAAALLVGRIRRVTAGISHRCRVDARELPEDALGAPEAAEAEDGLFEPFGEGRLQRCAQHLVPARDRHPLLAAGQRVLGADHLGLSHQESHGSSVASLACQLELTNCGRQPRMTTMPEATELADATGSKDPAVGLAAVASLRMLLESLEE